MSASRFLLPIVYSEGETHKKVKNRWNSLRNFVQFVSSDGHCRKNLWDVCFSLLKIICALIARGTRPLWTQWFWTCSQPRCTPLTAGMPAVGVVQRDCRWDLKNSGNSHWSCEPITQWALGNPNLYLDPPITIEWCQPIGGHVSFPTDSLIPSG